MSDTSKKISYESLAIDGLKEVLVHINEICKSLNIDFFIVGAIARNIWYVANDVNTGKDKVTPEEKEKLIEALKKENLVHLEHDIQLAPEWIRKVMREARNSIAHGQ